MLNSLSTTQLDNIRLWYVVQHSLTSFYRLSDYYENLADAVQPDQVETWLKLGIHKNHIQRLQDFNYKDAQREFQHCLEQIQKTCDFILLHLSLIHI